MSCDELMWLKPSLNASTTPENAMKSPSHWKPRRRSAGTQRGSSNETQNGAVYRNTVSREALVCCRPR